MNEIYKFKLKCFIYSTLLVEKRIVIYAKQLISSIEKSDTKIFFFKWRKQNERKVYKNSRQPVAYVVGKGARDKVPPKECLAHCNQAVPDRSDGCTASESPREACESQQRHSGRHHLCRNSKSCSERSRRNDKLVHPLKYQQLRRDYYTKSFIICFQKNVMIVNSYNFNEQWCVIDECNINLVA